MSEAAPSPRREPLLWLQLLGLGVMPLEVLLLLLLLAGSDPGPLPGLERLLCWAIGSLATALLLWKRPADVWSLLLVQTPLRGRRTLQHRLSALQGTPLLQAGLLLGCGLSLALLVWIDSHAALASSFSPLQGGPRLVALLLASAVLALLLWQWQQLLQALWLLSRPPAAVAATAPMTQASVLAQRLGLGIPLLLLEPLDLPESEAPQPRPDPLPAPPTPPPDRAGPAQRVPAAIAVPSADPLTAPWLEPAAEASAGLPTDSRSHAEPLQQPDLPADPGAATAAVTASTGGGAGSADTSSAADAPEADVDAAEAQPSPEESSTAGAAVAVEPEQAAADEQGRGLDQQVG